MKKVIAFFLILSMIMCLFNGCIRGNVKSGDNLIIQAVGVDFDFKTSKYKISLQVFDMSKTGGGGQEQFGNLTQVIYSEGDSIIDAINDVTTMSGTKPIFSQTRIIIFGEEVVVNGLDTVMDFFERYYSARTTVLLGVAQGSTAKSFITSKEGDTKFPAKTIQMVLKSGKISSDTTDVMVFHVIKAMVEKTTTPFIPALKIKKLDKGEYAKLSGMALFDYKSKLVGYMDKEETRGLLWLKDEINFGTMVIKDLSFGLVTVRFIRSSTKISCRIGENGSLVYDIRIRSACNINEIDNDKRGAIKTSEINEIEYRAAKQIKKEIESALNKCFKKYRVDPFGFGKILWLKYPDVYRKLSDNWQNVLPNIETNIDVNVNIRKVGKDVVHIN